jgi:hypothetical protein
MRKFLAWALAAVALVAAGSASATNNCSNANFRQLKFESSDTGGGLWQSQRDDSPLDANTSRVLLHVLLQDYAGQPFGYDYVAIFANCTGIEGRTLPQVRNLSFDFMNETAQPVHVGPGAPRIEIALDSNNDGSYDEIASLSAAHCPEVLGGNPGWSRADFTGRHSIGCEIWLNSNGVTPASASDGANSAWANLASQYPTWKVLVAYLVFDETGTTFVDRVAWHNKMYVMAGSGTAAIKTCPSEPVC